MQLRSFFRYFGSKNDSIKHYPRPKHTRIIEPFAGSASYATYYHENDVLLNELDRDIYLLWKWLIQEATPADIRGLPVAELEQGSDIRSLDIPYAAQVLIRLWQRVGNNRCWTVSVWNNRPNGSMWSTRTRNRIATQLHHIRHWRVMNESFENVVHDKPATWFIDPPYSIQSFKYKYSSIDYDDLGAWCLNRSGQVIVCEADTASWLPFRKQHQVSIGRTTNGYVPQRAEMVWVNDPAYMKKLDRKPIVMGNVFDMR